MQSDVDAVHMWGQGNGIQRSALISTFRIMKTNEMHYFSNLFDIMHLVGFHYTNKSRCTVL